MITTLSFTILGKPEWDYTANCGGYSDKGIVNVEITSYGDDQKNLNDHLMKCAVHSVIFRGIAPSKQNNCGFIEPLIKDMFAEENDKKFYKKFFEDNGLYKSFVSIVKENAGTEVFYKGQGFKKTMLVGVRQDALDEMLIKNGLKK